MSVIQSNPVEVPVSAGPARMLEGVLALVGNTPLIELTKISSEVAPVRIFGKAEWYNPGGSVKDRPALNMLLDGERRGKLTQDKIILDATSGNTGIAYAMFGAAMGYKVRLCVPKTTGALHQRILKSYGAELIFTPGTKGSDGAIEEARRLYADNPDLYFYPDQYNNPANWQAHYNTTSLEIIRQTEGRLTHFVSALGTSGTFTGNSRRFKEFNPKINVIAIQPDSPMHGLEGLKHMETSIKPGFYDESLADQTRFVATEDAQAMVKRLARQEGILVGLSAGAAVSISLDLARELKEGVIVTILCDGAGKYLDHQFWDK